MNSHEIRTAFLKFFEEKEHEVIPGSSLVPKGDPTLLLTTAGMVQIKPYFLGKVVPPNPRLASCQKCFRTTDIESVGDASHLTFFEMLGNFSVGDYFKKEAIVWAWEFVTRRMNISPERLWITIYLDDEEAFRYWQEIGVLENKIVRCGEEDNFWGPAGSSGPCGPCSEIHYDFGEAKGCGKADCRPNCECGRFKEIWNLVFTQYNQDEKGDRTPLPRPNIDTGMGLERLVMVMAGKDTVYDTDIFGPLLDAVVGLTGKKYGSDPGDDIAMRVVAEHGRALAFLIADGVLPDNEGRGYVLRRLLRRAALFGRKLGLNKPFLAEIARAAIGKMGRVYPELKQRQDLIVKVIRLEEARFEETLSVGLEIIDSLTPASAAQVSKTDISSSATATLFTKSEKVIPGVEAFKLYDTYGFPIELTKEVAEKKDYSIDMDGFEREMEKQRERARAAHKFDNTAGGGAGLTKLDVKATEFVGYHCGEQQAVIVKLLVDGKEVEEIGVGREAGVILDKSPFYAEMGGQVGDTGEVSRGGNRFEVTDTVRVAEEIILQRGKVVEGALRVGDEVRAAVDVERRRDIARNHTATHLLQAALRQVLGEHIQQRGSLVAPERLRFDFSHLAAMTADEIRAVQRIVNEMVRQNLKVSAEETTYREAVVGGAIALFDEKYGDVVRVMRIGEPAISTELCGGTHIAATGEIGYFHIVSEGSVGAGIRRVEAVTGRGAEAFVEQRLTSLDDIARVLETTLDGVPEKIDRLFDELEKGRHQALSMERDKARNEAEDLYKKMETIKGINVLAASSTVVDSQPMLREVADYLRDRLGSAIVVLGAVVGERPVFIAIVTPDLVDKGYHAGDIIKKVSKVVGGGGGGKANFAQAGGKDKDRLDEALRLVKSLVK